MHKIRKKCTPLFKLFGVFYFVYRKGITKGAPSMIEGAPKVLWLIAICDISFFHIIVIFKVAEPAFCGIATLIRYKIKVVSPFLRIGEKWDLQGICIGITWELLQRLNNIIRKP